MQVIQVLLIPAIKHTSRTLSIQKQFQRTQEVRKKCIKEKKKYVEQQKAFHTVEIAELPRIFFCTFVLTQHGSTQKLCRQQISFHDPTSRPGIQFSLTHTRIYYVCTNMQYDLRRLSSTRIQHTFQLNSCECFDVCSMILHPTTSLLGVSQV